MSRPERWIITETGLRRSICRYAKKISYRSFEEADEALMRLYGNQINKMEVYRCEACRGYHLGHI